MNKMKILHYLLLTLGTFVGASSCKPEFIEPTQVCETKSVGIHPKANQYQSLIDKYTKLGLPGLTLLINDPDGLWVGSSGKADIEKNVAMSPCHLSKVASITKTFVAVVALQLVEENILSLDEPVARWLSNDVVDNINNVRHVTLRQLLNHTTGIYDIIDDQNFYLAILNDPTKRRTLDELARFAYGKSALFSPGTKAAYSNTNTLLVSMVLERVTNKPHEQVIRERVFIPLGLQDTYYIDYSTLPVNTAQGYFDLYNNGSILNLSNYNTASGYGGMYSTVFDINVFIDALLIKRTLLTEAMLNEMVKFNPEIENGKLLGTGLFKDFLFLGENKYALGHRGRDLAYTADMFVFPNQQTTMVMFLNYGTDAETSLRKIFYEFRDELGVLITE